MTQSAQFHRRTLSAMVGLGALALAAGFAGGRATVAASGQTPQPVPRLQYTNSAPMPAASASYSAVVDQVAPAVVTVRVDKEVSATPTGLPDPFREFFGPGFQIEPRARRENGLGSGVIIRPDGYILTNHHVIDQADHIRVDLSDGRSFPATLAGSDQASDLAVLRIDATDLPTVPFGDSDSVKVGDLVLAFGNPLGVGQTVTMGIVSAKGRETGGDSDSYEDFLQTDAAINQGNSGGALVNTRGELVGINAQILSPSGGNIGLGFAIPSSMAKTVSEELITDGVVHRPMLGVTVQAVTPELADSLNLHEARGALVSGVEPGSPADRAGVRQGDVITELDHRAIADPNALRNRVAGARPGTSVSLTLLRNGKPESVVARLVERQSTNEPALPPQAGRGSDESKLGMNLAPLTPNVAGELDVPKDEHGLVVTDVNPNGAAAVAGIQPGDVITTVNGEAVASVQSFRSALTERTDKPSLVLLDRHGASLFVTLPAPAKS